MTDATIPLDRYDELYAAKLWSLVPAVYRTADATALDETGPLQELLQRIAAQVAVVRRAIDRLWEDQSIETCDSWVIPYLGALLDTNLVPAMDSRAQRLDVANTIYYRRRKGTLALVEQLAADVTGYETHAVEFFRRLGRTRHGLDPEIGRPADTADPVAALALQRAERLTGLLTGTPAGGFADLRVPLGATSVHTAYDEYSHFADVRLGRGALGWYGIPKLGVFLWRVVALAVDRATPVPVAGCPGHYTFDPTGRSIPLFLASARGANDYGENWRPLPVWQLPMPLSTPLADAVAIAGSPDPTAYPDPQASFWPGSLTVRLDDDPAPLPLPAVRLWPEVGRFAVASAGEFEVGYHYGLFSRIGAGPYDRRVLGVAPAPDPVPVTPIAGDSAVTLPGALASLTGTGTVVITDGRTLTATAPVGSSAAPIADVCVRAADEARAVIRAGSGSDPWVFQGAAAGQPPSRLRLEGLLVSGTDVVLRGSFDEVAVSCCTFDPGSSGDLYDPPQLWADSVDGRPLTPTRLWVEGTVRRLSVDRSMLGPVRTRSGGLVETLAINDSTVQGLPAGTPTELTVYDPGALFGALRDHRDPLSAWLASSLSSGAEAVHDYTDGTTVNAADLAAVIADLQTVVEGPLVWTAERFADRPLRDSLAAEVAAPPAGEPELGALNRALLAEAYPTVLADAALATSAGTVELSRCTVLGEAYVHRLECSESILDDVARVVDAQHGCVRFTAWATGSALPRRYESVRIDPHAPIFLSRRYGEWGYAMVSDGADAAIRDTTTAGDPSILTGSHDGSEVGVFCRDRAAIKDRSLLIKFEEYLPVGVSAVLLHEPAADPDGESMRGRPWPPT